MKTFERQNKKTISLLISICIIAALIRLYLLGESTFWLDETISWLWARSDFSEFLKVVWERDPNMVLYYLLLRPWLYIGQNEWVLRSLSAIFGVGAVIAIYFLGSKLFGKNVGILSAILLTIHAFHVHYSQEARSYSLLVFLLICSTYYFVCAIESPKQNKFWVLYIISSVLAVYAHLLAIIVLVAQVLSIDLKRLKQINFLVLIRTLSILILLTAPYVIFSWIPAQESIEWISQPTTGDLKEFLFQLTGNQGIILTISYLILILLALFLPQKISHSENKDNLKWQKRLLVIWFTFPIAFMYLISLLKPMLVERYLLICVPPLIILASYGLFKLSQGRFHYYLSFPFILLLIILSMLGLKKYFDIRNNNINEWKPLAEYVISSQHSNDCIYHDYLYSSFDYYVKREIESTGKRFFPVLLNPYPLTLKNIENKLINYERMWLIFNPDKDLYKKDGALYLIRTVLSKKFKLDEKRVFKGFGINTGEKNIVSELYIKK